MRNKLLVCVLAVVMLFSMAVPAMAATQEAIPITIVKGYNTPDGYAVITPFNELTRIYLRTTPAGVLQFRVWGITSGRWLTDWINV